MFSVSSLPANMQAKVIVHPISDCWRWTGARNPKGYGSVANGEGGSKLAHRASYELLVGPIPEGLTIDHLCLNTSCVNPEHMEPVTRSENSARKATYPRRYWVATEPPPPPRPGEGFADIFDRFFGHRTVR